MSDQGGLIDVALKVPDSKAVDDIRDPWLRALTADALDTGTDPQKLRRLEHELLKLGYKKSASAIGLKARQIRELEDKVEKKIHDFELLGDKVVAAHTKKLLERVAAAQGHSR